MNTEIFDYLKKLSKKEFFFVNLLNSIIGVLIILLSIVALADGITMVTYAFMFGGGAIMLLLNCYKGVKRGSKSRWLFLVAGIVFAAVSALFFYAVML